MSDNRKIVNKKLSTSSRKWVERHISDSYVRLARKDGYVSRAAYKLIEMQKRFNLIKCGDVVLDLGAAPGSWSQIASTIVTKGGVVVALDLLPIKSQVHTLYVQGDCYDDAVFEKIFKEFALCTKEIGTGGFFANVILSDMSPNLSGCKTSDHLKCLALCERVIEIANKFLVRGGSVVMKFFQGSEQQKFLQTLGTLFHKIRLCKPEASRSESCEVYIVALNKR